MPDGKLVRGKYAVQENICYFTEKDKDEIITIGNMDTVAGQHLVNLELNGLQSYAVDLEDRLDENYTTMKNLAHSVNSLRFRTAISWYICLFAIVVCAIIVLVN